MQIKSCSKYCFYGTTPEKNLTVPSYCRTLTKVAQKTYEVTVASYRSSTYQHVKARAHTICTQPPRSDTISSWSFLPASTRRTDVVPLRTAPCHSAPAGHTGKCIKTFRMRSHMVHGHWLPRCAGLYPAWDVNQSDIFAIGCSNNFSSRSSSRLDSTWGQDDNVLCHSFLANTNFACVAILYPCSWLPSCPKTFHHLYYGEDTGGQLCGNQ